MTCWNERVRPGVLTRHMNSARAHCLFIIHYGQADCYDLYLHILLKFIHGVNFWPKLDSMDYQFA